MGRTPLHMAAARGSREAVEALLRNGGDPTIASMDGKTPLARATENGHYDVIKVLVMWMDERRPAGQPTANPLGDKLGALPAGPTYPMTPEQAGTTGVSLRDSDAETLHAAAADKYFEGDYKAAESLYLAALSKDPQHVRSLCNYGALLHNVRHDHDKAMSMYQAALQACPDDVVTLYNCGLLLEVAQQDFAGAENMYQRALAIDPNHVDSLVNYGSLVKMVHRDYPRAQQLYEKALQLEPDNVDALCNYALLLRDGLNQPEQARQLIGRAQRLSPDDQWLQQHATTF